MVKYRITLTERIKLKTFIEIEVSEAVLDEFIDGEGIIDESFEQAGSTCEFADLLQSNGIEVIRFSDEYDNAEIDELEYDDYYILEEE